MSTADLEKCDATLGPPLIQSQSALAASATVLGSTHSRAPSSSHTLDDTFPDGGRKAWLTVLGAFLALLCTFGQLTSFGTFQSWYADHQLLHLPPSTISWIGSLQFWVFFFSGGFIGRFYDSSGPKVLMIPGTLLLTLSVMLTSICTKFYQYLLCQGALFGIGVGLLFYPSLAAVSTYFLRYRATALGIAFAGSGVGGVIYPIMLRRLFATCGFAWAVRISGFITLALCIVATCAVSTRLEKPSKGAEQPWFDFKHLTDATFMLLVAGGALVSLGLFIPNFYIVSYATERGVPSSLAFSVLAVMNGSSILGRLAPPYLSDVLGRFNMLVPSAFFAGLFTMVLWTFARTTAETMLYAVIYGFFSGAFNALVIPCIAQISDIREIGVRIGMLYTIISFPSLAGGPAAGALLKLSHGSYLGVTMLSGASVVFGSLFIFWSRIRLDSRLLARA
ncbi:MFS general substrate transporter [Cristinia sonorae]|uniref:MFS general substrate transporter n=1 Tax=Cristinia sonorae TaxID=1940300 RepID=A0A8K0XL00_9AGAR|nr:MFS general substrate transporter [Cristinia sonorae]